MVKYVADSDRSGNATSFNNPDSEEVNGTQSSSTTTKEDLAPIELIDEPSVALRRPVDIVNGRAYAAISARVNVPEDEAAKAEERMRKRSVGTAPEGWLVVRNDGVIFGNGGDRTMAQLRFPVYLNDPVPSSKRWRAEAVQRYRRGSRPDPVDVFHRIESVYDRFIDFELSLADQRTMCRFSACFSLATWFLPAFSVIGYPWVTGERGSGKSQWGQIWAETSYLGHVTTAGSTFATLRDLADYGATLVLDDAENLSKAHRVDPDKRNLMLAGNRRGAHIMVKEPKGEKGWQIRYVNAFGPRGFTAIERPEGVLASRCIVIPLVRTADPKRGNLTPADHRRWPCDRDELQDDLWALALHLMIDAESVWAELDYETETVGREFEPWRPLLAVARLFEQLGVDGLEEDVRSVMRAAQREGQALSEDDRTVLVIRALLETAGLNDMSDMSDVSSGEIIVTASNVAAGARTLARQAEVPISLSPQAAGKILRSLRLRPGRTGKERFWLTNAKQLVGLGRAYGVLSEVPARAPSEDDFRSPENVTDVTIVTCKPETTGDGDRLELRPYD